MAGSVEAGRGALGGGRGCLDQLLDGLTGTRAGFQPVRSLVFIQGDLRWVERGVISADLVNEPAVPRRARIRHHDAEERFFSAAMAAQPHHNSHEYSCLLTSIRTEGASPQARLFAPIPKIADPPAPGP